MAAEPGEQNGQLAGDLAVDTAWNLVHYRSTDGTAWALYWNGSQWTQATLGSSANVAGHLSVDSVWHNVYYRGTDGQMWVYYVGGGHWLQTQLSATANIGSAVTADTGGLIYYASSADNSAWAEYWTGRAWSQTSLGVTPILTNSTFLYSHAVPIAIDSAGRCQVIYVSGNVWTSAILETGGSNLAGGLSAIPSAGLIFAIRTDSSLAVFVP